MGILHINIPKFSRFILSAFEEPNFKMAQIFDSMNHLVFEISF